MRLGVLIFVLGLWPTCAQPGAWPREEGKVFLSFATRLSMPKDVLRMGADALVTAQSGPLQQYDTIYLEYGLTPKVTLGIDYGRSVSGGSKLVGFVQHPLSKEGANTKVAFQLGLGEIQDERVVRPGLMIGWPLKQGWVAVDTFLEYAPATQRADIKLDATAGFHLKNDRNILLQIQAGESTSDPPFIRFAPSYVFKSGKRSKTVLGLTWGLKGDDSVGVKIGAWAEF